MLNAKFRKKLKAFFTTKDGQIVIGQFPNWPLFVAAFFYAATFTDSASVQMVGSLGLRLSLLIWSYLEIHSGVNSWRKFLGWMVLTYTLISWIVSVYG